MAHDQPLPELDPATSGGERRPITGWRLQTGPDGTDLGPVELPHRWEDDPRIGPDFSGTLAYVTEISSA